jgi:hypothetical protein
MNIVWILVFTSINFIDAEKTTFDTSKYPVNFKYRGECMDVRNAIMQQNESTKNLWADCRDVIKH